jgi:hypothetical protein
MLRMLKQARAFGVGLVLVTQNPVDVDYKGISNSGTWFIGKLQTDQDKQRLLDGLEGAMSGSLNRSVYDRMISSLGKRVFLMHNVHNKAPLLMQTRWAMNYLTGPLTRTQIPALNTLAGAVIQPAGSTSRKDATPATKATRKQPAEAQFDSQTSPTRPPVPVGINVYFLPNNQTLSEALKAAGPGYEQARPASGLLYRPVLLAQSRTLFLNRKYDLDYELLQSAMVADPDRRGLIRWENFPAAHVDERQLDEKPAPQARFASLDAPLNDAKIMASMNKDFTDWTFRQAKVTVRANESLKIYAGPNVTQADFRKMCSEAAQKLLQEDTSKVSDSFDKKIAALVEKMKREQRELEQDQTELSQRTMEEMGTAAETIFGLFSGKRSSRRISSSLTKRRLTAQAKADVDESKKAIEDYQKQVAALEKEKTAALAEVEKRWGDIAGQSEEIAVAALKKDVDVELFGVAWFPFYLVQSGDKTIELPAYSAA